MDLISIININTTDEWESNLPETKNCPKSEAKV